MNSIQYRNFRGVKEGNIFEVPFNDITILVGKNNSGKSTMVKALLLVLDYLKSSSVKDFDFANENLENTNIVTFGRAKNKYSKVDLIIFKLTLEGFTIQIDVTGNENDKWKSN